MGALDMPFRKVQYLHCHGCGKQVSTGFYPVWTPTMPTPDEGLIIRAWIECPECIEAKASMPPPLEQALAAYKAARTEWYEAVDDEDNYILDCHTAMEDALVTLIAAVRADNIDTDD